MQRTFERSPFAVHAFGLAMAIGCAVASGLRGWSTAAEVGKFLALFAGLFALYFWVVWLVRRGTRVAGGVTGLLLWAALFRLLLLPAGLPPASWWSELPTDLSSSDVAYRPFLLYDNDVWRYLWDGHVFVSGENPYARSPAEIGAAAEAGEASAAALLAGDLWQEVFDRVSYQDYLTVYPPLAQLFFALLQWLAPGSVFVWKLALALLDLGTCWLLVDLLRRAGRRPEEVVVYAWNPLVLKELAGSGHVDGLMIFCLVGAVAAIVRGRQSLALLVYGLAFLAKLTPALLGLLFLRRTEPRRWPVLALTVTLGCLPFLPALARLPAAVASFAGEWVFNPGPWLLIEQLSPRLLPNYAGRGVADAVALLVTLGLVLWTALTDDGELEKLAAGAFLIFGGYIVASATVMPWYLLWVLPFAALRGNWAWLVLSALSLGSYLIYIDRVVRPWWLWVEFGIFFACLGIERWRRHRSSLATVRSS